MVSIDLEINARQVLGGVFGCTMKKKGIPRKYRVRYVLWSEMKALRYINEKQDEKYKQNQWNNGHIYLWGILDTSPSTMIYL